MQRSQKSADETIKIVAFAKFAPVGNHIAAVRGTL